MLGDGDDACTLDGTVAGAVALRGGDGNDDIEFSKGTKVFVRLPSEPRRGGPTQASSVESDWATRNRFRVSLPRRLASRRPLTEAAVTGD